MNVRLISVTPQAELTIGHCARVSNPANQKAPVDNLLRYMIQHKHWSPFEMANMVVEIKTSRAISQQIVRHRSFSFQEFSQRYAEVVEFELYSARRQDDKNRQNSIDDLAESTKAWFEAAQIKVRSFAEQFYMSALDQGIAKEQARMLLPMASSTTLYMNGTLRSWIHYIELRTDPSTQLEHREIAEAIKQLFIEEFPIISAALGW